MNTVDIEKEFSKMIDCVDEIRRMTYSLNIKKTTKKFKCFFL